jgi:hypothetical protein
MSPGVRMDGARCAKGRTQYVQHRMKHGRAGFAAQLPPTKSHLGICGLEQGTDSCAGMSRMHVIPPCHCISVLQLPCSASCHRGCTVSESRSTAILLCTARWQMRRAEAAMHAIITWCKLSRCRRASNQAQEHEKRPAEPPLLGDRGLGHVDRCSGVSGSMIQDMHTKMLQFVIQQLTMAVLRLSSLPASTAGIYLRMDKHNLLPACSH